jgi:predicted permease
MTQALADALTPIFVGLLLGFYAGRRGLMDNINVRNLIVLVMNFAVPCAMFLIIAQSSRSAILLELNSALAMALVFGLLFAGSRCGSTCVDHRLSKLCRSGFVPASRRVRLGGHHFRGLIDRCGFHYYIAPHSCAFRTFEQERRRKD